jgi:hypothetical protein
VPAFFGQTLHKRYTKGDVGFDFSGVILLVRERLDVGRLRLALSAVLKRFQGLRLYFVRGEGDYPGYVSDDVDTDRVDDLCYGVEVEAGPGDGPFPAVEALAQRIASSFDPFSRRPLVRIVVFDLGPDRPHRVLVAFHHFVCDGLSNQIVWREIARAYDALAGGRPPAPAPLGAELTAFGDFLQGRARQVTAASLSYWLGRPAGLITPPGCVEGENAFGTWADSETRRVALTGDDFRRFVGAAKGAFRCSTAELLLAAYVQVLGEWLGRGWVAVANWTTAHLAARDAFPMDRTVGCFAFPAFTYFFLDPSRRLGDTVAHVRERQVECFEHALEFGLCQYLEVDRSAPVPAVFDEVRRLAFPHFTFCYMGEFRPDPGPLGAEVAPERIGSYLNAESEKYTLFDLDADVSGEGLFVDLNYPKGHPSRRILALLCDRMAALLRGAEVGA